jgi:hypothetical protein
MMGALLLLISLFVDWYSTSFELIDEESGANAWAVFETLDLVLAGIAVAVIYAAYEQIGDRHRLPGGLVLPLSVLALLIVASQLIDPPPAR